MLIPLLPRGESKLIQFKKLSDEDINELAKSLVQWAKQKDSYHVIQWLNKVELSKQAFYVLIKENESLRVANEHAISCCEERLLVDTLKNKVNGYFSTKVLRLFHGWRDESDEAANKLAGALDAIARLDNRRIEGLISSVGAILDQRESICDNRERSSVYKDQASDACTVEVEEGADTPSERNKSKVGRKQATNKDPGTKS